MRRFWTLLLLVFAWSPTGQALDKNIDFAPIIQVEDGPTRLKIRILGPLIESTAGKQDGVRTGAFRPLFSRYQDFSREHVSQDILYPLLSYRLNGIRLGQRGFIGVSIDDDVQDDESSWQDYILPIYFNGRGKKGQRYFAIFPIGGDIRDVFGYEHIQFWVFPLYMRTVKSNGIKSKHILWPIFQKTDGDKVRKRKVFPLIGYAERPGVWRNNFVLWPLINWGYSLSDTVDGWGVGVLPLYAYMWMKDKRNGKTFKAHNVLWPFFLYAEGTGIKKIYAPWPFFQYTRGLHGPESSQLFLWPLWGYTDKGDGATTTFWLWPLGMYYERPMPWGVRKTLYMTIYMRAVDVDKEGRKTLVFTRFWPFYSSKRDNQGHHIVKILDIIPYRNVPAIDQNLSPLWTLYEYRKDEQKAVHDILWGWIQYRRQNNGKLEKASLFPIFNYEPVAPDGSYRARFLLGLYGKKAGQDCRTVRRYGWIIETVAQDDKNIGHGILPLYSYERNSENELKQLRILLGLYGRRTTEDGETQSRYMWLFSNTKKDNRITHHSLFPFYDSTHTSSKKEFNIFKGLFGTQTNADGSRNFRLLWFFRVNRKRLEK